MGDSCLLLSPTEQHECGFGGKHETQIAAHSLVLLNLEDDLRENFREASYDAAVGRQSRRVEILVPEQKSVFTENKD